MPMIAHAARRLAVSASRARPLALRHLATAAAAAAAAEDEPRSGTALFVEEVPATERVKLPQFTLGRAHGFLPRSDPLPGAKLPKEFELLSSLLDRMTIVQPGETEATASGLLATGEFGPAVHEALVDGPQGKANAAALLKAVQDVIDGKLTVAGVDRTRLLSALFRDFCFFTSAYLLEPVDQAFRATGLYAPGRDVLPAAIAQPMVALANELGHFPFMEYSSSYALQNYDFQDKDLPSPAQLAADQSARAGGKFGHELSVQTGPGRYAFNNLKLIRAFQNPYGSEAGFILVHVEMLAFSARLLSAAEDMLIATEARQVEPAERAFMSLLAAFREVQASMSSMWNRSLPQAYLDFRTYIYGTKGAPTQKANAMFPNGVTYEGAGPNGEDVPMSNFRGESGANDSIIPLADNLLELTAEMPNNEFTRTLRDFRRYRPKNQREYLGHLESRASQLGLRSFCTTEGNSPLLKALYVLLTDQVREFRHRRWQFTRTYIINNSDYSIATGGSNILRYLPNNLATVLKVLDEVYETWTTEDDQALLSHARLLEAGKADLAQQLVAEVHAAGERAHEQRKVLDREVAKIVQEKADKNPNIEESQRGMLGSSVSFDRLRNTPGQARQYHTLVGLGIARCSAIQASPCSLGNMKVRPQRGWVGCDGVG